MSKITNQDRAYIACILDNFGGFSVRRLSTGTAQPVIQMFGQKFAVLQWLGEVTNTKAITVTKVSSRHICTEHCPDKHGPTEFTSMRWQVTGMKATIVLHNVAPYMRQRQQEAKEVLRIGLSAPFKESYVEWMESAGWHIPDLDPLKDADRRRVLR